MLKNFYKNKINKNKCRYNWKKKYLYDMIRKEDLHKERKIVIYERK